MKASARLLLLAVLALLISACSATPPKNRDDLCAIFKEKKSWYSQANKAQKQWQTPIPIMMAFINQESSFQAKARPPRKYYLGFIPGPRPSSAYGYAQVKNETWKTYQRATGRYGDDRDDIGDALMFIGWYNDQSFRRNHIAKTDAYRLYLAYHEGQGGFQRGSFEKKPWLKQVATKVQHQAQRYQAQLKQCEKTVKRYHSVLGIWW